VGEMSRPDLVQFVRPCVASTRENCAFWAAWSLAVLAPDASALDRLRGFVAAECPRQMPAAEVLFRRLSPGTALDFQRQLAKSPGRARLAISVAGIIGDPGLIPWLLEQMDDPERKRLAADAFQTITGADFVMDRLRLSTPPRPRVAEDFGEDQPPDPDADLIWPKAEAVKQWWMKHRDRFTSGTRHLLGKPITLEWLRDVLLIGQQHQRGAAALELAMRQPGQALFNVVAPGFRQEAMLKKR